MVFPIAAMFVVVGLAIGSAIFAYLIFRRREVQEASDPPTPPSAEAPQPAPRERQRRRLIFTDPGADFFRGVQAHLDAAQQRMDASMDRLEADMGRLDTELDMELRNPRRGGLWITTTTTTRTSPAPPAPAPSTPAPAPRPSRPAPEQRKPEPGMSLFEHLQRDDDSLDE